MNRKVAFLTLGCKLNFAETSTISRFFIDKNIEIVEYNQYADFYVINTCSVTANANKKSRNAISRALSKNPNAVIIVTGCYAQLKPEEIERIDGVDYIFGANNKEDINRIIDNAKKELKPSIISIDHKEMKSFFPAYSKGDRTRSFLKIQDGCDYFCSYCTIPYARGRSRNQSIGNTVKLAEEIADEGIKEIIISGVNIGDFGKSTNETFFDLLKELVKVDGIERFRLGSIEPNLLTDEIIHFIAENKKLMPHFHIPLQSGSDEMLKIMQRKYDTSLFRKKIELINKLIPNAFIGIDLIVGVNGETDKLFDETYSFIKSINVSFVHLFQYSERENTLALDIKPRVSPQIKKIRAKKVNELSQIKHSFFLEKSIGEKHSVLFETGKIKNKMLGYTDNYIRVEIDFNPEYINAILDVKIQDFAKDDVMKGTM